VCPPNLAAAFEQFLFGLEQPAKPNQSERDYLHDYPGYTTVITDHESFDLHDYVKAYAARRTSWRLDALDENTAFVGIGYSLDSDRWPMGPGEDHRTVLT